MAIDPHKKLRAFTGQYRTQTLAAEALGISPSELSAMLRARRDVSAKVLAKLGLAKAIVAVRGVA